MVAIACRPAGNQCRPAVADRVIGSASLVWAVGLLAATCFGTAATWLSGCAESPVDPQRPQLSPPPVSELTGVAGHRIQWTVDQRSRGSVRYGHASGAGTWLAYPEAGEDKIYCRRHAVPLLSARPGQPVYLRRVDHLTDGRLFTAAEETVVLATGPPAGGRLRWTCLDVQFGDAHVLQLPGNGKVVLIDAGNPRLLRNGRRAPAQVRAWLASRRVERIDVALATHIHYDHYGGFVSGAGPAGEGLLQIVPVDLFLDVARVSGNRAEHAALRNLLADLGVPRLVIESGQTDASAPAALAWDPLVRVKVLGAGSQPEWAGLPYEGTRLNNDSIVLKISFGEVDLICGGDCEEAGEARILTHHRQDLDGVEFFKAHHHGRSDANSLSFVQAVVPRASLIPVAFAAYREGPAVGAAATAATLEALTAVGADVFRFDAAEPLGRSADHRTFWHTTLVSDGVSFEMHLERSLWPATAGHSAKETR